MLKKLFNYIFASQISELNNEITELKKLCIIKQSEIKELRDLSIKYDNIVSNIDVSIDYHQYSNSWCCISIQGQKADYIKFIDLGDSDIKYIQNFLRNYEKNIKIDATPQQKAYIINKKYE